MTAKEQIVSNKPEQDGGMGEGIVLADAGQEVASTVSYCHVALAMRPDQITGYLLNPLTPKAEGEDMPLPATFQRLTANGGLAIIDIKGPITNDDSLLAMIFGELSQTNILDNLREALTREDITAVVLNIDSPGGVAAGTPDVAKLVRKLAEKKATFAFTSGAMASAAYWIGSAVGPGHLFLSENAEVGSIGVVLTHIDTSQREKMLGVKIQEITAGEFKRAGSSHAPLDAKGRAYMEEIVNSHMKVFRAAVSTYRALSGASLDAVANGKIFIGQDAVDAGLADGLTTLDDLVDGLRKGANLTSSGTGVVAMADITLQLLESENPELLNQIRVDAASAERARVAKIRTLTPAGLDAVAEELVASGATVEQAAVTLLERGNEQAAQAAAAQRTATANTLAAIEQEAPAPVTAMSTPAEAEDAEQAAWDKAVAEAVNDLNANR